MSTPPTVIVKHQNTEGPISSCITTSCCGIFLIVALIVLIAGVSSMF